MASDRETKLTSCPSCDAQISRGAYDCPSCGHPIRKPKRGFFGKLFKWSLILFNVLMVIWLVAYAGELAELSGATTSDAEQAGLAIGGTLGVGMLLVIWVIGDIILGLATLLTRPSK